MIFGKNGKLNNVFWTMICHCFGFWNVYHFPKNIPCLFFLGHNWRTEEKFKIVYGTEDFGGFSLSRCSRCGSHKWGE